MSGSCTSPVETQDAHERFLELFVGERVAERVDRAVEIAQPVGQVVQRRRHTAGRAARTEADDQRQDVPRRPAEHERAEYRSDGAQGLASAILLVLLHLRGPSNTADVLRTSLYSQRHQVKSS